MRYWIVILLTIFCAQAEAKLRVMVIDTGVSAKVRELAAHMAPRYTTNPNINTDDSNGHGTHVAGIIFNGACADVELIPCKAYFTNGEISASDVPACIRKAAANRVDIINISMSGFGYSAMEDLSLRIYTASGGTAVVAAGNLSIDLDSHKFVSAVTRDGETLYKAGDSARSVYPAEFARENKRVIAVGSGRASRSEIILSKFTNRGKFLVYRDGENIISYAPDGTKKTLSGTSMAAAVYSNELVMKYCNSNHNK